MKAVFVIDVDKDELGKAFATIMAEENGINFFARGVIRPLPQREETNGHEPFEVFMYREGWNRCLEAITGETE